MLLRSLQVGTKVSCRNICLLQTVWAKKYEENCTDIVKQLSVFNVISLIVTFPICVLHKMGKF